MRRPLAALALLFALLPGAAAAQSRVAAPRPPEGRRGPPEPTSLRAQLGIPVAQRLLASDDPVSRVRGVERLGAIGTPEAIDALVEVMESSSIAQRDARMRLTAVRVLAGETRRANVRQLMLREVTDTTGAEGRGVVSPLVPLIRGTAALALARGGDRSAVGALAGTLLRPGAAADAAAAALRAYPPESLEVFVESKRPPKGTAGAPKPAAAAPAAPEPPTEERRRLSPPLASFLGEIGDLRAVERLRALLAEGEQAGKLAAGLALARLGDEAALPAAREWMKKPDPRLKLAAAEVLVTLDASDAPEAIAALFEGDTTRDEGLRLALRAPAPALVAPLAKLLPSLGDEARPRAIAALGRARGAAELVPLLDRPETATEAAFALATMPGDAARAALEQALAGDKAKKGEARRLLLRAGTVRALMLDDPPAGLRAALKELWKGTDTAERAVGVFGLVALGAISLQDAVEGSCKAAATEGPAAAEDRRPVPARICDPALLGAAARGALALPDGPGSLSPLLPLLAHAAPASDLLVTAAGAVLLAHPDGADLPTPLLAVWAEGGGPIAPLAARALPARDDEALRGRIKRLLEGTDPVVRAHVALGLGHDPEPSAVTLLASAYRFEEDAGVRRAVVRALSRRAEEQRVATLTVARDLDPDEDVRALARGALEGRDLDPRIRPARGVEPRRSVAWITVRSAEPRAGKDAAPRAARLVRADGLAVPALADPDGVMLVPGLPPGPASLLLARP